MSHFIYLVRHGEQQDAEHGMPDGPLSGRGKRQAKLVADRLSGVPFTGAWYSPLQRAEDLEQLKVIEHGFCIKVALVDEATFGVDTPQDIQKVEQWLCRQNTYS